MNVGYRVLDRAANRKIRRSRIFRVDAPLQAYLGRAALPGFFDPPPDLRKIEVIRPATQVFAELALGECAELAAEVADIRVVDVAGYDIADNIAVNPLPELIRGAADRFKPSAARREELHDLGFADCFSRCGAIEDQPQLPLTFPLRRPLPRPVCGEKGGVRGNHDRWFDTSAGDPLIGAGKLLRVHGP